MINYIKAMHVLTNDTAMDTRIIGRVIGVMFGLHRRVAPDSKLTGHLTPFASPQECGAHAVAKVGPNSFHATGA